MSKSIIEIHEDDYKNVISLGGRIENINGTCKEGEILKELEPYKEDLKVAKGFIIKFVADEDSIDISKISDYMSDINSLLQQPSMSILGVYHEDIKDDTIKYEMIISGLPFKD